MRSRFERSLVLALVLASGAGAGRALAACDGEGPYEIRQCGARSWFAVPPLGPGTVTSAQVWQLGFGNALVTAAPGSDTGRGDGFADLPLPGLFFGNDSAGLDLAGLDLRDASTVTGVGGPAGSLCFSSASNWGAPGTDGCPDDDRTYYEPTSSSTPPGLSDEYLNTYVNDHPPYYSGFGQLDAPMAVLLKESGNTHFALAFLASRVRMAPKTMDFSPGFYDMDAITNGLPKPAGGNASIVPWQPIPQPFVQSLAFVDPLDPSAGYILLIRWNPVSLVHDGSVRPSLAGPIQLGEATGVGVLDQGSLVRYQVETAPIEIAPVFTCGTFSAAGPTVEHPGSQVVVTMPRDTCFRIRTIVGRRPSASFDGSTITIPTRNQNRFNARRGALGDIGYEVVSRTRFIGGFLVSESAVLTVAERNRNAVTIAFETTAELDLTGFDVVGKDARGERVLAKVSCKECTTGRGAAYTAVVPAGDVKGSSSVLIVSHPSGARSNELPLRE